VGSLSVTIEAIDESNLEDEVRLCVPSLESPKYSSFDFEKGVKDKVEWLRLKLKDYGYLGHIAYGSDGKPLGFIEFISSKSAPLPIKEETETTAIITCIDLHAPHGQGIGTNLLKATLRQLWKIGVCRVKTLVSRSPHWINDGIYRKHGFQLEKTFYKAGNPEPFDLLTFRLDGPQPKVEAVTEHLTHGLKDALPVEVVYFHSAQCPESSGWVYNNHVNAVAKFSKELVKFKTIDSWKNQEIAKKYGSMYFFDTFINGRGPFFGPPKQEEIEAEVQKEINRVLALKK
jgi:GNAT superfamily N-acetyltransferase